MLEWLILGPDLNGCGGSGILEYGERDSVAAGSALRLGSVLLGARGNGGCGGGAGRIGRFIVFDGT